MRKYQDVGFWDSWYSAHRDAAVEWSVPVTAALTSRVRAVLDHVPHAAEGGPLRVCELGCGTSSLVVGLRGEGFEVCGIDFSNEVVTQMQRRHPQIKWIQGDALDLQTLFPDGSCFDCVLAKTLLDTFLSRDDACSAIRRLFESVRHVLADHGWVVLLDRASATSLICRGHSEKITLNAQERPMSLRVLAVQAKARNSEGYGQDQEALAPLSRWEVDLPPLGDLFCARRVAGGAALVVQKAEGAAAMAGLQIGDRLLGIDCGDGKGVRLGETSRLQRALSGSKSMPNLRVLVERPANPGHAAKMGAGNLQAQRAAASQSDYFLRLARARQLHDLHNPRVNSWVDPPAVSSAACGSGGNAARALSTSASLPNLHALPVISEAVDVTKGLFKDRAPATGLRSWKAAQAEIKQSKKKKH